VSSFSAFPPFTYTSLVVSNLDWKPTYELHATLPKSSFSNTPELLSATLHLRVSLAQSTGEHWSGASLTLSTTAPFSAPSTFSLPHQWQWQRPGNVPRLAPLKLSSIYLSTSLPIAVPTPPPKSLFGMENGKGSVNILGGAPTPATANQNTGGLFADVPANAGTGTTGTGSGASTTTATKQQQQQQQPVFGQSSFPRSVFGRSNIPGGFSGGVNANAGNGRDYSVGSGAFAPFGGNQLPFGGASGGSQSQGGDSRAGGGNSATSANANSTVNAQGSAFGPNAFGSSQPSSAFGSTQPTQASSAFGNPQSQPQPQSQSQVPGFGASSSSQQPANSRSEGSSFARPATNNLIAPGSGAFNQPPEFDFGAFGSSSSQQPSQNMGSAFGQGTSAPTPSGFAQPTSYGLGPFGGSTTEQQPSSNNAFGQPARVSSATFGGGGFGQQQNSSPGVRSAFGGSNSDAQQNSGAGATPVPGPGISGQSSAFGAFGGVGSQASGGTSNTHQPQPQQNSSTGLFGSSVPTTAFSGSAVSSPFAPFVPAPTGGTVSSSFGDHRSLLGQVVHPRNSSKIHHREDCLAPRRMHGILALEVDLFGNTASTQQQNSGAGGLFGAATNAPSSGF
jgi:hypothetical protein